MAAALQQAAPLEAARRRRAHGGVLVDRKASLELVDQKTTATLNSPSTQLLSNSALVNTSRNEQKQKEFTA